MSLSSLRELTATTSAYNPPSPRTKRSHSPDPILLDVFEGLSLSSSTKPIPIPTRPGPIEDDNLPVTPLTGRFETDHHLKDWELSSLSARSKRAHFSGRRGRRFPRTKPPTRMRSDRSPFYSPVVSPSMSPTRRSTSPPSARSRAQNQGKPAQGFHLGSLPRFHPAVYQSTTASPNAAGQPSSARQSRPHAYRTSSGSRDVMWQYRDFMENVAQNPSAPRLNPLRSPGPVTPLALEEAGSYLGSGSVNTSELTAREAASQHSGPPPPDLVEKLIAREKEKAHQMSRKSAVSR